MTTQHHDPEMLEQIRARVAQLGILARLAELGVPDEALRPVREWIEAS